MPITDLSIIIIAHNEQFALKKCLTSIKKMSLNNCEIIFVDSKSTDNTLPIAESFLSAIDNLKIIKLTGYQNASIARNAGLKIATKNNIFFVDGDVELNPGFIEKSLDILSKNEASAVFGMLDDYEYDESYQALKKITPNRTSIKHEENRYLCGGLFMIKKTVSDKIGLFDEFLVRCEDFDYTLRLTKNHILKVIPVSMGNHHTIPYGNKTRMSNELKNNLPVYYGALLRKNIDNRAGCIAHVKRAGYLKGLIINGLLVTGVFSPLPLIPAIFLMLVDISIGIRRKQDIKYRLFSHYIVPIYVVYGFIAGPKRTLTSRTEPN